MRSICPICKREIPVTQLMCRKCENEPEDIPIRFETNIQERRFKRGGALRCQK